MTVQKLFFVSTHIRQRFIHIKGFVHEVTRQRHVQQDSGMIGAANTHIEMLAGIVSQQYLQLGVKNQLQVMSVSIV